MGDYLRIDKSLIPLFLPLVGMLVWIADMSFSLRYVKEELIKINSYYSEYVLIRAEVDSLKTSMDRLLSSTNLNEEDLNLLGYDFLFLKDTEEGEEDG